MVEKTDFRNSANSNSRFALTCLKLPTMKSVKLIVYLFFGAIISMQLESCVVSTYYPTAKVDEELRNTCNQAVNGLSQLENQLNQLEMKYHEIQCDKKPDPMVKADSIFVGLEVQMNEIQQLKGSLNHEYENFRNYTNGKSKIVSGTPEFKQLKITRKAVKSKVKTLQEKGNALVKNAEVFTNYTTHSLVPMIQVCKVEDFKKQIQTSINQTVAAKQKFIEQADVYSAQIAGYIDLHQNKKPDKCIAIQNEMQHLLSMQVDINHVAENLQLAYNQFDKSSAGKVDINSCSNLWVYVVDAENAIKTENDRFRTIEAEIQKSIAQLQSELK